ncbi:MAG TPA: GDSL-type esterase/lipase family protein, partial [Chloroflexota bacterium]|nr:GDSL-type esterase/lipase family protein [Chloroflexota bacterium]
LHAIAVLVPTVLSFLAASGRAWASTLVACVGDSITQYSGYPDKLKVQLGANYSVTNFGVAGTTLLKNGILPYWNSNAFVSSHSSNPNIVVIMLGTNDSEPPIWNPHKGEFVGDYEALIDSYRGLPSHPRIILNLCLPAGQNPYGISGSVIENEVNPLIRQVAAAKGVEIIDLFTFFGGHNFNTSLYGGDQVHPNAAGAQIIADAVYRTIVAGPPDGGADGDALPDVGTKDAVGESEGPGPSDARGASDALGSNDAVVGAREAETDANGSPPSDATDANAASPVDAPEGTDSNNADRLLSHDDQTGCGCRIVSSGRKAAPSSSALWLAVLLIASARRTGWSRAISLLARGLCSRTAAPAHYEGLSLITGCE